MVVEAYAVALATLARSLEGEPVPKIPPVDRYHISSASSDRFHDH